MSPDPVPPSPGPSGSQGPHVFVDDLEDPVISEGDSHHLERVLRLTAGDPLTVSDGRGGWRTCRFGATIEPTGALQLVAQNSITMSIAFALVKGPRPGWVTQKLTELGADDIRPFAAGRSVVRWDGAKAVANAERLRRVAREAAMQCRRCWLPAVHVPVPFTTIADLPGVVLAARGGTRLDPAVGTVAIGPEGGWAPEELQIGLPQVSLGAHVLRADTAAVTAAALLGATRAGLLPATNRNEPTP